MEGLSQKEKNNLRAKTLQGSNLSYLGVVMRIKVHSLYKGYLQFWSMVDKLK